MHASRSGLQLGDVGVDPLAQGNLVELVEHGFVEPLDDAVGLWAARLGAAVVDVLDREVELVVVRLRGGAILGASVGQHPAQLDAMLVEERHDTVVEQIGGGDRGLPVVELGETHLAVGVDEGLLVDAPTPFKVAT